eukprot:4968418-Pyramimonas_sp.AAC.1
MMWKRMMMRKEYGIWKRRMMRKRVMMRKIMSGDDDVDAHADEEEDDDDEKRTWNMEEEDTSRPGSSFSTRPAPVAQPRREGRTRI